MIRKIEIITKYSIDDINEEDYSYLNSVISLYARNHRYDTRYMEIASKFLLKDDFAMIYQFLPKEEIAKLYK